MSDFFEHSIVQFFWSVIAVMAGFIIIKTLASFIPEDKGSLVLAIKKTVLSA